MSATGTYTANGMNPDMSYNGGTATMPIVLADMKEPFSPTTTTVGSMLKESLPRSPVDIDSVPLPTLPKAIFDTNAPPQYAPNVTHAV
ncbi:hypothetical protein V8E55_009751 [Tylopilus felleus]